MTGRLTLYMKVARAGDFPPVDVLSLSMYCYLKYTSTPFQVKYTSRAPYVTILEQYYEVDESFEKFKGVVKDHDQEVRKHNKFQVFQRILTHHLQRLELAQLHYLYQKFPTFDWALERFTNIKERLDLYLSEKECEKAMEFMGSGTCQEISSILGDNVTLFRILINAGQWPVQEDFTVVEKEKAGSTKTIYWDYNLCSTLDVTLTRILLVISKLVNTPIYDQFIKYPNLVAYVERFISKFVKTQDAVNLSSLKGSYDFVEGLIKQSDRIGVGSYGNVYSCQFPQGNPLDLPAGTYAVKALTDLGAWSYCGEEVYLKEFQYDFAPQLFGYGDGVRKYFIMEYVSGGTLTEKIGELEYGKALNIIIDVCNGIHAIHTHTPQSRLLHDDLAPRNILLTEDGRAKIIDFGNMSVFGNKEQLIGSIYRERKIDEHLGPQPATQVATQSRDIFSLGILMIELFTAVNVLVHIDTVDTLQQEMARVPTLSRIMRENIRNSGCDDRNAQAILELALSCIRKDRSMYPKAHKVSSELRRIQRLG